MDKKVKPKSDIIDFDSAYIPLNLAAAVNEWNEGVQGGETCRIDALSEVFAWMRGYVNAFYGWSNDGKGTMLDYLKVIKAKHDNWKFCVLKAEDMDAYKMDGTVKISSNRIMKNLAWSLTGKTWNKTFADKHFCERMSFHEEQRALEFVMDHFFVVYPKDRSIDGILKLFYFMWKKYKIDCFEIDPWNVVELPPNERGDERLIKAFIAIKEFALETDTVFNIVNHAKSMMDVKEKDGKYKVVTQFMQLGGSAWDIKMDGQYSIYRPERHISPRDPKVHFYNLKQRQAEVVGVARGVYEEILFDYKKKQYYFNGVNPMDGSVKEDKHKATAAAAYNPLFDTPKEDINPFIHEAVSGGPDDLPF